MKTIRQNKIAMPVYSNLIHFEGTADPEFGFQLRGRLPMHFTDRLNFASTILFNAILAPTVLEVEGFNGSSIKRFDVPFVTDSR